MAADLLYDSSVDTPQYRNPDDIQKQTKDSQNPVAKLVASYDTLQLKHALQQIEHQQHMNTADKFGFTPLLLAIKSRNQAAIDLLLEVDGLDIEAKTKRGFNAVMIAAWKGDLPTLKKLVTKGAKLDGKAEGERSVWGIAHDWHHEHILEYLETKGVGYHSFGGTRTGFPPAPRWRSDEQAKETS